MSNWLNLLVEHVIINEGYKEVQNRITPLLQTQIPNFDPDRVKMAFSKHRNNKNKLPGDFQNIDAYFAKKYDAKLKDRYEALIAELDKIPDKSVTKQQSKNNLFEELKIVENDEYILFKVRSHDDAVKLVRPGKNNPYGWPAMLPVTWCITADSEEGEEMWVEYCYDDQYVDVESCTSTNIVYLYGSSFYFAFRKHPKYDMEMDGKKVNPMDFIAIQAYVDGHYEYTPAPNDDLGNPNGEFGHGNDWPSTVPESWKQYCGCHNRLDDLICDRMNGHMFIAALVSNPQFADLAKKYNIFEKLDGLDWFQLLQRQPQFADLAKKYNVFEKIDIRSWGNLLQSEPKFADLAKKYNVFEKFNGNDWCNILRIQPQFIDLAKKYNAFEKFNTDGWCWILQSQPQFIDLAKKYNVFEKFNGDTRKWSFIISQYPQFVGLAKEYNVFEKFNSHDWSRLLQRQPQFANLAKIYNVFEKFDSDEWCWILRSQPQFIDLAKKYNAFEKFDSIDWGNLLRRQPQFADLAKEYGYRS